MKKLMKIYCLNECELLKMIKKLKILLLIKFYTKLVLLLKNINISLFILIINILRILKAGYQILSIIDLTNL